MHKIAKASILVISILVPGKAMSWGFEGHEFIGNLSWHYMTPEARDWVTSRLNMLDEESLATATTWADRVRGTELGREMGPLHYANIPPHDHHFDMDTHCPDAGCVVSATIDDIDRMKSGSAEEQADALRRFSHWITDMHQPLHLGFAEDRGGNSIRVRFFGMETNLHRVWDSLIVAGMELSEPEEFIKANTNHLFPESVTAPQGEGNWSEQVISWAEQSNQIAREQVYNGIQQEGDALPRLGQSYYQQATSVVALQLHRSAIRMAAILNEVAEHHLQE